MGTRDHAVPDSFRASGCGQLWPFGTPPTAQPPLAVQSTVRAIWYAQELGHRQALDVARTLSMLGTDGKSMAAGQEVFRSGQRGKWRLR